MNILTMYNIEINFLWWNVSGVVRGHVHVRLCPDWQRGQAVLRPGPQQELGRRGVRVRVQGEGHGLVDNDTML